MKKSIENLIKILFISFLTAILTILYAYFIEPKELKIIKKDIYLPSFYSEHNGLKIAVLSDFHFGEHSCNLDKLRKIIEITNKENPYYIFLLGDFDSLTIKKNNYDTNEIAEILSGLHAKYGVYSVLGNHDIYPRTIKPMLKKTGIKLLENEKVIRKINSKPLVIYGTKDLRHFNPEKEEIKNNGGSIIFLAHNPDIFPEIPDSVSLTLSGHTHGGQICLPFAGGIFTPSKYGQRYNKGLVVENGKHIYITSGIGNSIPFRLGVPPEIVILTLYSQQDYPEKKIENTKPLKGLKRSLKKEGYMYYRKLRKEYPDLQEYLPEI